MKKLIVVLILFSCNSPSNQEKYRELFQKETNLNASFHDLSQMVSRMDSAAHPETFRVAQEELRNLKQSLDSVRKAMKELPGYDSIETNKYSK